MTGEGTCLLVNAILCPKDYIKMHGQRREDRSLRKLPVPSSESKSTPGGQTGVLLFECSPREVEILQGRSSLWRSFGWQGLLRHHREVQNPECLEGSADGNKG